MIDLILMYYGLLWPSRGNGKKRIAITLQDIVIETILGGKNSVQGPLLLQLLQLLFVDHVSIYLLNGQYFSMCKSYKIRFSFFHWDNLTGYKKNRTLYKSVTLKKRKNIPIVKDASCEILTTQGIGLKNVNIPCVSQDARISTAATNR